MKNSRLAAAFITAIMIGGCAMLAGSVLRLTAIHQHQFLALLALAAVTSRTKVKLPGVTGTMSVNLPFMLIAAAQLSLFEAVIVALVSATIQSLPKNGDQFRAEKLAFNASTIVLACGVAAILMHSARLAAHSGAVTIAAACAMFFLVNTVPVATIISLTEGSGLVKIWSSIAHLSFPYYVACTGVTSMVTMASKLVGWQAPLIVLPVMLLMYRSFQEFFRHRAEGTELAPVKAMARGAGAR